MRRLWKRLQRPVQKRRQAGIALVMVSVTVAVLGAVMGEFAYNARVDLEGAANARDELRAEYLARSGINLARLLIKVQQSVLDRNRQFIGDIQIAEFAPYLIKAFGGEKDERDGLGAMLGLDTSKFKGLGVGKGATFDLDMGTEDGKLNLNCGGGLGGMQQQPAVYGVLSSLFWPPRYNRLFETPDADGQYTTRDDMAKAILDWADVDESKYDATGNSSGAEDYRYDTGRDPFRAHNHYFDTVEELNLVRGVGDEFWGSFGEMLTVYGGCKVNIAAIKPEHWPLMAAILRATVKDDQRNNSMLADDVQMAGWAQAVTAFASLPPGIKDVNQFVQLASNPVATLTGQSGSGSTPPPASGQPIGLPLDPAKVNNVITVGPRRYYRLDSTGIIQRTREKKIQVHVRAVWDAGKININSTGPDPNDRVGSWVYWRED
jgi:general secretion pathway protein K